MEETVFNNNQQAAGSPGFTLIELMVALLVFMIIMLGLVRGQVAAIFTNSGNVLREEALRLAEDQLSQLQGAQFTLNGTSAVLNDTVGAWTNEPTISVRMRSGSTNFRRVTRIKDIATAGATALKQVEVAVGYTHGSGAVFLLPTNMNHQVILNSIIVQQ